MSNDNLINTDTNLPNFSNPRVLAGFIDLIGQGLTDTLNRIGKTGAMTAIDAQDLVSIHRILYQVRQGIGYDNEFGMENQLEVVAEVTAEIARVQAEQDPQDLARKIANFRANAKAIGLPDEMVEEYLAKVTPQESISDAAERILREI